MLNTQSPRSCVAKASTGETRCHLEGLLLAAVVQTLHCTLLTFMDTKNVEVGSKRNAAPFSLSLTLKSESFQKRILVFLFNREGL